MKLKNILSVFCCLVAMVSCSMDDETVVNDISKEIAATLDDYVWISTGIGNINNMTKAETETGGSANNGAAIDGDYINRCVLFLLDGEKVVAVSDTTLKTPDGNPDYVSSLKMKFLTKVSKNPLKLVAVVNYDGSMRDAYLACSTLTQLNNIRETNAANRVLVGEIDNISLQEGSPSTVKAPTKEVGQLTVAPRVACIDLTSFNVRYQTSKHPEVKLTGIYYNNIKTKVGLFKEGDDSMVDSSWKEDLNFFRTDINPDKSLTVVDNNDGTGDCNNELRQNKSFFATFPNTTGGGNGQYVQMRIDFTVDGESHSRTYTINRPTEKGFDNNTGTEYICAGYWYRLSATVNVTNTTVDCSVVCYTNDWIYKDDADHNISGDLVKK